MRRSLAPGKWTVAEILCHLADTEIAFSFRWRQTLAEEHHIVQPFDQDHWATHYASMSGEQALKAFIALRRWNAILLDQLSPGDWERHVTHPERGEHTFRTLVETMAGHDLNHLRAIGKNRRRRRDSEQDSPSAHLMSGKSRANYVVHL